MQLNQADISQLNQQQYLISGIVDFSTVPDLLQQFVKYLALAKEKGNEPVNIDWSQVKTCNSAALALMLEIAKNTQKKNIPLQFENLPTTLLTIAKAYGVEKEIREFC